MSKTLYTNAVIHSPEVPDASAMLVDGQDIAWLGSADSAKNFIDDSVDVVDCDGNFIAPGFVDSHAHITATGAALNSLDLSGCKNAKDVLDAVAGSDEDVVLGHTWDETTWENSKLPTIEELDRASQGRRVYLARIDYHSALINSVTASASDVESVGGWDHSSVVEGLAHEHVSVFMTKYAPNDRKRYQEDAFHDAASKGIVAIAEMGGPTFGDVEDMGALLSHDAVPTVLPYWAELFVDEEQATSLLAKYREYSFLGFAGDLNIDGSMGSRTAYMHDDYSDMAGQRGNEYLTAKGVATHLEMCTKLGVQGGFHVIGDEGMANAIEGSKIVEKKLGAAAFRRAGHRLEHAECITSEQMATAADLNISMSVQPEFDLFWGEPGGMYEQRVGQRYRAMNPFKTMMDNGIALAFGSDTPVTPFDPWGTVKAAMFHHNENERMTARAAFNAHTKAGWRAAQTPERGVLAMGAMADFALWDVTDYGVQTPGKAENWSTDTRSRTPLLPLLEQTGGVPECLLTVHEGHTLYSQLP